MGSSPTAGGDSTPRIGWLPVLKVLMALKTLPGKNESSSFGWYEMERRNVAEWRMQSFGQ